MKRTIIALSILLLLANSHILASGGNEKKSGSTYELIEANYLAGLNSGNCGLRNSCAYYLGEMKSAKAVIPLMKILRNCDQECARIYAALSLIKIGDPRGVFLVKRLAYFDDSERVKRICSILYNACINPDFHPERSNDFNRYAFRD